MGVIDGAMNLVFGGGRNVVSETMGVFRENAEAQAQREAQLQAAALGQFASEFQVERKSVWDRFIDGVNRIPRPALALGTLGLFVSAMVDPVWFAARMNGIALVPEPLWWLLGAIVSFYFGARHQVKSQEFQRSFATTIASTSNVVHNLGVLDALARDRDGGDDANPALNEWLRDER
ncbi:holin family protein [Maritimibacter dapengensis]|uniref:Holin family protein n=1 Tax=Maritimibacter dapengensis TaxID=2836868 RepID=A0ABS6T2F7_9RHOB|nr:holin family protein [Maritimibacter dapengensis]MBV7379289.1 holin family protein [Maritimibacter dapengensis]